MSITAFALFITVNRLVIELHVGEPVDLQQPCVGYGDNSLFVLKLGL
jgi:hypothetical protein